MKISNVTVVVTADGKRYVIKKSDTRYMVSQRCLFLEGRGLHVMGNRSSYEGAIALIQTHQGSRVVGSRQMRVGE